MLQKKYMEYNKELHMVLVDLEKDIDAILRELIWYSLRKRQMLELYIDIIRNIHHPGIQVAQEKQKQYK